MPSSARLEPAKFPGTPPGDGVGPAPVWLIDSDPRECDAAGAEGLAVICGNALQEQMLAEAHAAEADTVLAMTPNAEVNALAAATVRNVFQVPNVMVADTRRQRKGHLATLQHLQATDLFGGQVNLKEWDARIERGEVEEVAFAPDKSESAASLYESLQADRPALPLVVRRKGDVQPFDAAKTLQPGDEIVLLRARYVPQPWHHFSGMHQPAEQ